MKNIIKYLHGSDYFVEKVKEILEKRESSLYVDFKNSKLNVPSKQNPAVATEEINRAWRSIQDEETSENFELEIKKKFREIKRYKVVRRKAIND
jgi:hypothetical protein